MARMQCYVTKTVERWQIFKIVPRACDLLWNGVNVFFIPLGNGKNTKASSGVQFSTCSSTECIRQCACRHEKRVLRWWLQTCCGLLKRQVSGVSMYMYTEVVFSFVTSLNSQTSMHTVTEILLILQTVENIFFHKLLMWLMFKFPSLYWWLGNKF